MYINGTGTLNTRLNIDVLSDPAPGNPHKIQWDLFLRSLLELQQAPPEDPLGYYRIAGIKLFFFDTTLTKTTLTVVRYPWLANGHVAGDKCAVFKALVLLSWKVSFPLF